MIGKAENMRFIVVILLMVLCASVKVNAEQLNQDCVVNILNRTVQVAPGGGWTLPNVPSSMGQIRARATCVKNGITTSGQTDYFTVQNNGITSTGDFIFGAIEPVPQFLDIQPASQILIDPTTPQQQLVVMAMYPDGTSVDTTQSTAGTNYTSSNPAIATVSANGLVTGLSSGSVIITVRKDGVTAFKQVSVLTSGDTDGDGLPDDFEIANGLDPSDPIDAHEDQDSDGLSAFEEFTLGTNLNVTDSDGDGIADGEETVAGSDGFITNPLLADTDGDGLSDGLEILVSSDPTDSNSINLADALSTISVSPSDIVLTYNLIDTEVSEQLTVTGDLIDGTSINLTSTATGTQYISSNLAIVSFGAIDGELFGGQPGTATVTVSNNGHTTDVSVTVENFATTALSAIDVPGVSNSVDTSGDYAYVAGSAGLTIIDVSDRAQPILVTTLNTGSTIQDVKIFGALAYLAGSSGLQIVDITNAASPVLVSTHATAGPAQDLRVDSNFVYLAIGTGGFEIVNVEDPTDPATTSVINTIGDARGVDFDGDLALVTAGASLHAIDIQNRYAPAVLGSINVGTVRDVVASDGFAYVAAYTSGYQVVDYRQPDALNVVGSGTDFYPNDVELAEGFAFFSDILFVNGAPYVNNRDPLNTVYSGFVDFSSFGDDNGKGIAVDSSYLYLVTDKNRLLIGQYRQIQDNQGIAPTVTLKQPTQATGLIEGGKFLIDATAEDDVAVRFVTYLIDDVAIGTDSSQPYHLPYRIPVGATSIRVTVQATDFAGNTGVAEAVFAVAPDADQDGLSNDEEMALGTDPNNRDTDGDGVSDGVEIAVGTSPLDPADFPVDLIPIEYVHPEVTRIRDLLDFKGQYYLTTETTLNTNRRLKRAQALDQPFSDLLEVDAVGFATTLEKYEDWLYVTHQGGVNRFDGVSIQEKNLKSNYPTSSSAYPSYDLNIIDGYLIAGVSYGSGYGNAWRIMPVDDRFSNGDVDLVRDYYVRNVYHGRGETAVKFKDFIYFGGSLGNSPSGLPAFYGANEADITDVQDGPSQELMLIDAGIGTFPADYNDVFIKASNQRLVMLVDMYGKYSSTVDNVTWVSNSLPAGYTFARVSRIVYRDGNFYALAKNSQDNSYHIFSMNESEDVFSHFRALPVASDVFIAGGTVNTVTYDKLRIFDDGSIVAVGQLNTSIGNQGYIYRLTPPWFVN